MKIALVTLATGLLACGASAQVKVIGNGPAKACYEATERGQPGFALAIDLCNKALTETTLKRSDQVATLVNRAILYMRAEDLEKSEADLDRARKLAPDLADLDLNVGALRLYQGRNGEAISLLTAAIEAGANDLPAAYYNRGVAYERSGDLDRAYRDYTTALALKPGWQVAIDQIDRFEVVEVDAREVE